MNRSAGGPARSLGRRLRALGGVAFDLVVPRRCGLCGRFDTLLCARCAATLPAAAPPRCPTCWAVPDERGRCRVCASALTRPLDGVRSAYRLDGGARRLVLALKYDGLFALAEPMGGLMAVALDRWGIAPDAILPVPLHPSRQRRRGFNQAALLARWLGERADLAVDSQALRRIRRTLPQVRTAGIDERQRNVADAFAVPADMALPGSILLIDDVCTTGATLRACAATLRLAGCHHVYALTFARED